MFSGKDKKHLNPDLIASVDLLIDGPYIESQKDETRILLGSKNKSLVFVTDRYVYQRYYFDNPTAIEEVTAEDYIFINGD
jgi:anaerobic ribonucleoside-triphosphate reductase activating protein